MRTKSLSHSFCCAAEGLCYVFTTQRNMKIHILAALLVFGLAWRLEFSALELAILALTVGLVLVCETLNTALEAVVNLASPNIHPLAKQAKDAAAGAVLISAMISLIIGGLLFWPHL